MERQQSINGGEQSSVSRSIVLLGFCVSLLGLLGLSGHLLNIEWLGTFRTSDLTGYQMTPPIAIGLITLGLALSAIFNPPSWRGNAKWLRLLQLTLPLIAGGIGLYTVSRYLYLAGLNPVEPFITNFPDIRVPFLPALNLFLSSLALLAFPALSQGRRVFVYLVDVPAILMVGASTFVLVGHFLNEPILFNFGMVIPSALAFIASGLAILIGSQPYGGILSPLFSPEFKVRAIAIGAIVASIGVVFLGLYSVFQINTNLEASRQGIEIVGGNGLYAGLELGTILLALLVMIVSLRATYYYNETLFFARAEKRARQRETVLRETIQAIHGSITLEDTFEQIVNALGTQLHCDRCFIAKYNKEAGKLSPPTREFRSSENISSMLSPSPELWESISEYSLKLCKADAQDLPVDFDCYTDGLSSNSEACLRDIRIESGLAAPIIFRGRCLAMLFIHQVTKSRQWTVEERVLVQEVAGQAAVAISQAELYHRLQESNRDLEQFASIASHDLRAPLRKAQIFLGQALEDADDLNKESQNALSRAQKLLQQMQNLIADLLNWARISRTEPQFEPVPLSNVLHNVVANLEPVIENKQARIEVGHLETVIGDQGQLEQLLQNLIENGLKYQPEGQIPVLRVQSKCNAKQYCEITVEDNGIGFKQEYAEKVFEPFERLHGKASTYSGTGVGLAICKRIAERHGGSISAKSKPGEGAKFTIRLPL